MKLNLDELALHQAARAGVLPTFTEFLAWPEDVRERVATVYEQHRLSLAVSTGVAAHGTLSAARVIATVDNGASLVSTQLQALAERVMEVSA